MEDKPYKKLYLGKYLIALYDENDRNVGVWYNPQEMEDETGLSRCSVSRVTRDKSQKYMRYHGMKCKLYLIPWKQKKW